MSFSKTEKEVKKITMNQFKDLNNKEIQEMVNKYTLYIIMSGLTILKIEEVNLQWKQRATIQERQTLAKIGKE